MFFAFFFQVVLLAFLHRFQYAAAADLVIKSDFDAWVGVEDNGVLKAWNVYLGQAEWNDNPGFLRDDGALIALARDAFKRMRDQAEQDGVNNKPNALSVMIFDKKAYMSSSITRRFKTNNQQGNFSPGDLLALVKQPLFEQTTLDGPTPAYSRSYTLATLDQCLHANQNLEDHEAICGEPIALHLFWAGAGFQPDNRQNGLRGQPVKMVTWGRRPDGTEGVFRPCTGGRTVPNSMGCTQLLQFVGIPFITSGNPGTYNPPDRASAATICVSKDDGSD